MFKTVTERIVAVPLSSPDNADPNTLTALQCTAGTQKLSVLLPDANRRPTIGHAIYFVARDALGAEVAGATVTFKTWVHDETVRASDGLGGAWAGVTAAIAPTGILQWLPTLGGCNLYVQITATTGVGVVSVDIRPGEVA